MISTSTKNQMQRGVAVEVTTVKKEDVLCIKIKSDTFHRLGLLKANRDFSGKSYHKQNLQETLRNR